MKCDLHSAAENHTRQILMKTYHGALPKLKGLQELQELHGVRWLHDWLSIFDHEPGSQSLESLFFIHRIFVNFIPLCSMGISCIF